MRLHRSTARGTVVPKGTRMRRTPTFLFVSLALLSTPGLSHARSAPTFEVSAGYQLLHFSSEIGTMPVGWYGDVAASLGRRVSAVFHVGGNYKTLTATESAGVVTARLEAALRVHEFLGGVRASVRSRALTPFGQLLVGAVNGSANVSGTVTGGGQSFSSRNADSSTDFGLMVGGGVTFHLTEQVGLRVSADYLRAFMGDAGDLDAFRMAVGAVFPF